MASTFSLSAEQVAAFERAGMLRIQGYFARPLMSEMADRIWADLRTRFHIDRLQRETWTTERPAQFQSLIGAGAFDGLGPGLAAIADAVFGEGALERPRHFGLPLVTFPTGAWDVPHTMWHIDLPSTEFDRALSAVRVFVLLEPVLPKGGGTCYVEGSHRVLQSLTADCGRSLRSQEVRTLLIESEPWFAALFSSDQENREQRFMGDAGVARGVEIRVRETIGEPGDIYVMHPAMLHTAAPNARDRPRMMLAQQVDRRR